MNDPHLHSLPERGDSFHAHEHGPKSFGFAFALGISLNLGFVFVEAAFGFISNSTALIADAGHNLSDVLGLVVAWAAAAFLVSACAL